MAFVTRRAENPTLIMYNEYWNTPEFWRDVDNIILEGAYERASAAQIRENVRERMMRPLKDIVSMSRSMDPLTSRLLRCLLDQIDVDSKLDFIMIRRMPDICREHNVEVPVSYDRKTRRTWKPILTLKKKNE